MSVTETINLVVSFFKRLRRRRIVDWRFELTPLCFAVLAGVMLAQEQLLVGTGLFVMALFLELFDLKVREKDANTEEQ